MAKKIIVVAGARPNFIKIAPLMHEFKKYNGRFATTLVHTGQHYDFQMSEIFFKDLDIPRPDIFLNVGSASHAVQTANIMIEFEKVVLKENPDLVIVVGDVNSTLACSLVAAKLNIKIAHVEAGLRSFDRTMPEETNRIVTDSVSDYLFVSEESGLGNLKREGVDSNKVHFVGNVMIDTLLANMDKIDKSDILTRLSLTLNTKHQTPNSKLQPPDSQPSTCNSQLSTNNTYAVLTLHRPSNVDSKESLAETYDILESVSRQIKIVYPIHPRTKKMMEVHKYLNKFETLGNLLMVEPLGYIDFIKLVKDSKFVLTDSGGIQEETTVLKVPCLTMRENTERPVTIEKGTNYLVGRDKIKILKYIKIILNSKTQQNKIPKLWDGRTAKRIVRDLLKIENKPRIHKEEG